MMWTSGNRGGAPDRPIVPRSEQRTHQNAEIVARDVNEVAFVNIFATAQPCSAHAATLQDMGETALDDLATFAHGFLAEARLQPVAIAVDLHFKVGLGAFDPIFSTSIETFAGRVSIERVRQCVRFLG